VEATAEAMDALQDADTAMDVDAENALLLAAAGHAVTAAMPASTARPQKPVRQRRQHFQTCEADLSVFAIGRERQGQHQRPKKNVFNVLTQRSPTRES
jgi:hypothetical protein